MHDIICDVSLLRGTQTCDMLHNVNDVINPSFVTSLTTSQIGSRIECV